jgi:hypothetical protein
MKIGLVGRSGIAAILAFAFLSFSSQLRAQFTPVPTESAFSIPGAQLLKPEALLPLLQAKGGDKPLLLQVGSRMLFAQAHIPGSEYIGPGSVMWLDSDREKSTLRIRLLFSYADTCVQTSASSALRLHDPLQKMRREHPGSGRHHAGFVDCRAVPDLRREEKLSSIWDISRQTLAQTWFLTGAIQGVLTGEMKRAIAREREAWAEQMQEQARMKSTLVIAAAIIAAVRLARDSDISRPSPRLTAVVSESVSLARMILDRVGRQ